MIPRATGELTTGSTMTSRGEYMFLYALLTFPLMGIALAVAIFALDGWQPWGFLGCAMLAPVVGWLITNRISGGRSK